MSIAVKNLSFSYGKHRVLREVSFTAETGQLLAVLGPNGVGKSTLFQCILGLNSKYNGQITIDGDDGIEHIDIRAVPIRDMARRVAYIPQSHAPVFNYSVFDIVLMGTTSQVPAVLTPGPKQTVLAEMALELLGIAHLRARGYMFLSGGERQLVLIARALAQDARILIMDEPTANLDYGNQIRILTQIKELTGTGYTIIQSTHHPDQAFLYADRVLALSDGEIAAYGTPQEVLSDELIRKLYNVEVEVQSLYNDKVRVCLPKSVINP